MIGGEKEAKISHPKEVCAGLLLLQAHLQPFCWPASGCVERMRGYGPSSGHGFGSGVVSRVTGTVGKAQLWQSDHACWLITEPTHFGQLVALDRAS